MEIVPQQSRVQSVAPKVISVLCGDGEKGEEHGEVHDRSSTIPTETRPTPQEMTNPQRSGNMVALCSCFLSAGFLRDKRNSHLGRAALNEGKLRENRGADENLMSEPGGKRPSAVPRHNAS